MAKKTIVFYILFLLSGFFATIASSQCSNPNAGVDISVCGHSCSLETVDVTTGHWEAFTDGGLMFPDYSPSNSSASINVTIDDYYGVQCSYIFIWIDNSEAGCRDTVIVSFYQCPDAYAGHDITQCGPYYETEATYSIGDVGYNPSGLWSVLSKPTPSANVEFDDETINVTGITVSEYGVYRFIWIEQNTLFPSCSNADTVQIEFVRIPVVYAGDDQDVCGSTTQLEATTDSDTGYGIWSCSGLIFDDSSLPTTTVIVGNYGSYNLTWMSSNFAETSSASCIAHDEVKVIFFRVPSANLLMSESDSVVCGLTSISLRAESPGAGVQGHWHSSCDNAQFGDVNTNNTWVTVDTYGLFDFYFVECDGPDLNPELCTDTTDVFSIRFIEVPNSYAGEDDLFCGLNGQLNATPSLGIGVWSTPSYENVNLDDCFDPDTHITSNIFNTGSSSDAYFDMIWTEDNTNGCTDKDTVRVIFARIPSSDFSIIPSKCFGEIFCVVAEEDSLWQYQYDFYGAVVDSIGEPNESGGFYQSFVHWEDGELSHRVSMHTVNYWGCLSDTTEHYTQEPAIPEFGLSSVPDVCARGLGKILCDPDDGCVIKWFEEDIGPPIYTNVTQVTGLTPGTYSLLAEYMTYNMEHYTFYINTYGTPYCTDTLSYDVENSILFDLRCPEDLTLTEDVEILLYFAVPQGGIYTYNSQEINSFDPMSYGNGEYEIFYSYYDESTECLGECSFFIFVNLPISVNTESISEISVYPNPNNGNFNVDLDDYNKDTDYEIFGLNGNIIQSGKIEKNKAVNEISISVSAGIYILKLRSEDETITKKLVVN